VLKLYREHFGVVPVATEATALLDAQAAWSEDRRTLIIGIVNPSLKEREIALELRGAGLTGAGRRWQIAGEPVAYNDPGQPPRVVIDEAPVEGVSDRLGVGPCSVTLFALSVR
jgi:alpha-L-arabinofuranosidase